MVPLLNAIYAQFASDSTLAGAFPGGLHRDRAPENTAMPYVVSRVTACHAEPSYGAECRVRTQVRFAVYGVGHDAVGALAVTLTSRLDFTLLALSAGIHDSLTRLTGPIPTLHKPDAGGNDVWEFATVYEYGVVEGTS